MGTQASESCHAVSPTEPSGSGAPDVTVPSAKSTAAPRANPTPSSLPLPSASGSPENNTTQPEMPRARATASRRRGRVLRIGHASSVVQIGIV